MLMASRHDVNCMDAFKSILGLEGSHFSDVQRTQTRVCTRHGGMGIAPSMETAHAAFLGSFANNKALLHEAMLGVQGGLLSRSLDDAAAMADSGSQHFRDLRTCHQWLEPKSLQHVTPLPPLNAIEAAPKKAQKAFTQHVNGWRMQRLMGCATTGHDRARIKSCQGHMASAWLHAVLASEAFEIDSEMMKTVLRFRLGMEATN